MVLFSWEGGMPLPFFWCGCESETNVKSEITHFWAQFWDLESQQQIHTLCPPHATHNLHNLHHTLISQQHTDSTLTHRSSSAEQQTKKMAPTPSTGYMFHELMMWHSPGLIQVRLLTPVVS